MKSKKALCIVTSLAMLLSFSTVKPNLHKVQAEPVFDSTGTFDGAIANEDKVIQMLKNGGKIAKNATPEDAEKILHQYLKDRAEANGANKKTKLEKKQVGELKQKLVNNGLVHGNGKKIGNIDVKPVQEEPWNGTERKDRILVLLIDYPDYPHNSIKPGESDMYYKDYSHQHYQDMIFGDKGYTGPNGENVISMKQYYEQQSGGSYTIEGTVAGWYRAAHDAAYYGANSATSNNIRAKDLVYEALTAAAKDPSVNLANYDQLDPYDLDGDGNIYEPDGMIDHLMVLHSGVGEEAGGGSLGENAVWSHRSKLGNNPVAIPGSQSTSPYWNGKMVAWDYTIEPEDGAAGVFAHEYGHDLGLPDEYDTEYTGKGEPISYWSIMSSGSWAGKVPGTEPVGFSPYAKQFYQATMGGNWLTGSTIEYKDINNKGLTVLLDQANTKGTNNDAVRINLPDKGHPINTPVSGKYEYFGGTGTDGTPIDNYMTTSLDLSGKTAASLSFKTWYDIEEGWDFASVQAKEQGANEWTAIPGNITTTERDPGAEVKVANGITGSSKGQWVDAAFDLSQYAGKKIDLKLEYQTDSYSFGKGFYVDNIIVSADNNVILSDNADGTSLFTLKGFTKDTGVVYAPNYYLIEWRNHAGVDKGLAHIAVGNSLMSFDPGLLVWYVDDYYTDNWTGVHPGEGFLGLVDADQHVNTWNDAKEGQIVASTRYQVHDAAFSQEKADRMSLDVSSSVGWSRTMLDKSTSANTFFDDSKSYTEPQITDAGRNVPNLGIKIRVAGESKDMSAALVAIYK